MITRDTQRVCDLIQSRMQPGARTLVGISGPPASGKSTLADAVVNAFNQQQTSAVPPATLVPMDGYHLDNHVLETRGLLARKGAPETFDAVGFCAAIKTLASAKHECFFPKFDRQMDLAIANAIAVHPETPVVVVEGNYLLLDKEPWASLSNLFSATIFVSPTLETLQARLQERWIRHGFDPDSALRRAMRNDIPNAQLVLRNSQQADLVFNQNGAELGTSIPFADR